MRFSGVPVAAAPCQVKAAAPVQDVLPSLCRFSARAIFIIHCSPNNELSPDRGSLARATGINCLYHIFWRPSGEASERPRRESCDLPLALTSTRVSPFVRGEEGEGPGAQRSSFSSPSLPPPIPLPPPAAVACVRPSVGVGTGGIVDSCPGDQYTISKCHSLLKRTNPASRRVKPDGSFKAA
ncbi:hypothetical protein E2C01_005963 [Portunus trituberculatus]|uniref:Uncharacterized protein n=1 Tax=Portunus trituberculatus TaxID=210409 RepID=A0A5B7CV01_PORTR|nr:hypothetical protein [Portunus trituberculatus]